MLINSLHDENVEIIGTCILGIEKYLGFFFFTDESKVAGKQKGGSRTPRKSKRMAAKLDGHSSFEGETTVSNSKSVSDRSDTQQSHDFITLFLLIKSFIQSHTQPRKFLGHDIIITCLFSSLV